MREIYKKNGRDGQKVDMVFLLAVFNYTELTGGLDIMTCRFVVYIDNVYYVCGENKTEALVDDSVNVG
jgi:hypothetical protein